MGAMYCPKATKNQLCFVFLGFLFVPLYLFCALLRLGRMSDEFQVDQGKLGTFQAGQMVAEFDKVVFDPETTIGVVQGPLETQFGYHLILVEQRTMNA